MSYRDWRNADPDWTEEQIAVEEDKALNAGVEEHMLGPTFRDVLDYIDELDDEITDPSTEEE